MKTCYKCKKLLPNNEFWGKNSYCKKCHNLASTATKRKRKEQAVAYLGGKCSRCGYDVCITALEFHHKDPTEKEFTISKLSRSFDKIKDELDKCVLLCSNCHREEHFGDYGA